MLWSDDQCAGTLSTGHSMTKCIKVLRAKAKAESMDQSQARTCSERFLSEPVIGPCFLLLLLLLLVTI